MIVAGGLQQVAMMDARKTVSTVAVRANRRLPPPPPTHPHTHTNKQTKYTQQNEVFVLQEFIINQEWLDPKSQLQQCCHSLRDPTNPLKEGKEYFHPVYKYVDNFMKHGEMT